MKEKAKPVLPPHLRGGATDDDAALMLAAHKERARADQVQRRAERLAKAKTRATPPAPPRRDLQGLRPWRAESPTAHIIRPGHGLPPALNLSEYAWDVWRGERY